MYVKKEVYKDPRMELLRLIHVDYTMMQASNAIGWVQEPYNCVLCDKEVDPSEEQGYPYCEVCNEMVWDIKDNKTEASGKSRERLNMVLNAMLERGTLKDLRD